MLILLRGGKIPSLRRLDVCESSTGSGALGVEKGEVTEKLGALKLVQELFLHAALV